MLHSQAGSDYLLADMSCRHSPFSSELRALMHRRGQVCMIPGTREFFIALVDHDEWGGAHTVWGEVSRPYCQNSGVRCNKQQGMVMACITCQEYCQFEATVLWDSMPDLEQWFPQLLPQS